MGRFTVDEEDAIVEAYGAWDPRRSTTAELIDDLGITRASLYNVLKRRGIDTKERASANAAVPSTPFGAEVLDGMARLALDALYQRVAAAERRVVQLEQAVRDHPRCKHARELRAVLDAQS